MNDFIEELKWRGLFTQMIPGTEECLKKNLPVRGYIGFDPTAPSLGIGNMVQVMILKHYQRCGHQPIAVVGGATGMVGDPSGKSSERNLLTEEQLDSNVAGVEQQLRKLLDFDSPTNPAILVNNYDFYRDMNVLAFLRDVGKHLTVNYMLAKDSVKSRLETGISYTEFSYQLLQAYDFVRLYKDYNCLLQMGGSDQWGNLTAGTELIRRMEGGEVYAVTSPLITKADGTKFGKTEKGNIFLSAELTSPYQFYQFWMNASDEDAEKYIRIFTIMGREEIEALIAEHRTEPHVRKLQKRLAEEVTVMVHSREDYDAAVQASQILFGKATKEVLQQVKAEDLLNIFEGVPQYPVSKAELSGSVSLADFLVDTAKVFPSKGEVKRAIQGNALAINSEKVTDQALQISAADLLNGRIIWVQNGKKNNYLVVAE
jgi:tyrosyl-tRNA synthetase